MIPRKQVNIIFYSKSTVWLFTILVAFSTVEAQSITQFPCGFLDSVNITNGVKNNDDSITFEGITYPKNLYAFYDHEFLNESYSQPVDRHLRGCVCAVNPLKPCVRLCCPRGQYRFEGACHEDDMAYNMSVASNGMESTKFNIFDAFNYVSGKPCPFMDMLEETWVLSKNGSILKGDPPIETLNKDEYCLNPIRVNNATDFVFETTLLVCYEDYDNYDNYGDTTIDYWILCGMLISIPFLLITITVYIAIPELRNVHGLSLVCYLLGLLVGYTTISLLELNGNEPIEATTLCRTSGYIVYFSFMSAFFWLNVISFDLWRNTCGTHTIRKFNDLKQFLFYSIYAWGSTIVMVIICVVIDSSSLIPSHLKPGFGVDNCFLAHESRWQQFIYLYLPIILIMGCNLTFFILTSLKIHNIQKEMAGNSNSEQSEVSQRNLEKRKARWCLFLRLFIVMGVSWTMEAISWIFSVDGWFFHLTDVMNAIQGVVIFVLFVMRRKVKELAIKRWKKWRSKSMGNANSVDSIQEELELPSMT